MEIYINLLRVKIIRKKIIIITGAARGIGKSIALTLCERGHKVIMFDVLKKELETIQAKVRIKGKDIKFEVVDVSKENDIRHAVQETIRELGTIDILINNAAISPKTNGIRKATHEIPLNEWNEVIQTNLTSVFLFTKFVLPTMVDNKEGKIINMSSQAGRTFSRISGSHYSASKSGIIGFTRTIANEYGKLGITANCIAPGRINTTITDNLLKEENQKFINEIPVGRAGEAFEIASLVSYLCNENSSFINGATIDINGGMFMN